MPLKRISLFCVWAGAACFLGATMVQPGGYDWNRDYISTLLRATSSPVRRLAVIGMLLFCVGIALVFARLARAPEFSKVSKAIRIGGIGSMVYAALACTPMHDLMVTIAFLFFLVAVLALLWALPILGERTLFICGCLCSAVLVVCATAYYAGDYGGLLAWTERASFAVFAAWLFLLDGRFARHRLQEQARPDGVRPRS